MTDDTSITINKIAADYLQPGERVKVPQHAIDNIVEREETILDDFNDGSRPKSDIEQTIEAVRAPDIHEDENGDIIETMPEEKPMDVVVETPVQEVNSNLQTALATDQPEDIEEAIGNWVDGDPIEIDETNDSNDLSINSDQPNEVINDTTQDIIYTPDIPEDVLLPPEEEEEKVDDTPYIPPKHNFNVKWEPKFAAKDNKEDRNIFTELSILAGNYDEFNHEASKLSDKEKYDTEEKMLFLAYLEKASELFYQYRSFDKSLTREGSSWQQFIESDVGPLALSKPNFGKSNNGNLTGEKAILKMNSIMNLGQLMSVPLWHTGIWVKLKAPSDAALLALENRIAEEKTMLGRQTNGFVFANASAYMYDYLINLILSCVYDVTYIKQSPEDLRKIIKIRDIPALVWGFLCTIYPNGYPIAQPCINNISKCKHIEHEMVSISKLMWTDKSSLTPLQIKHMTKRDGKFTDDDIAKYQNELQIGGDKLVAINDKLSIMMTTPSIQDYIDSGYSWVEGIESMINKSFAVAKQGDERNEYILAMSETMALRQYSHWVKEIRLTEDPTDIDDVLYIKERDTVDEALDNLSKDPDLAGQIILKIMEFIDNGTMSVVGIPRYMCPVCGTDQGKNLADDRYIIPLDVVRIFFTLQNQRLLKVTLSMNG